MVLLVVEVPLRERLLVLSVAQPAYCQGEVGVALAEVLELLVRVEVVDVKDVDEVADDAEDVEVKIEG